MTKRKRGLRIEVFTQCNDYRANVLTQDDKVIGTTGFLPTRHAAKRMGLMLMRKLKAERTNP